MPEPGESRTYRLSPAGAAAIMNRTRLTMALMSLLLLGVAFIVIILNPQPVWISCLVIGFFGMITLVRFRQHTKRFRATLLSLEITVTLESITRKQLHTPEFTLRPSEIANAEEVTHALVLRPRTGLDRMIIHRELDNYDELRASIAGWLPIVSKPASNLRLQTIRNWLLMVATVISLVIVFVSSSRAIVVPLGLAVSAYLVWSIWAIQRSRMLDRRTKRLSWFIPLPLIGILSRVYILWTAGR